MGRLNLGCGGDIREGFINADRLQWTDGVIKFDYNKETIAERWGNNYFNEIYCRGVLIEFEKNIIEIFNDFYQACADGAIITIVTSVVDNGLGTFRDPVANHHYHSEWADYIAGQREAGGRGLGLRGRFERVSNNVAGEVQTVVFKVIKPYDTDALEAILRG